MRVCVILVLPGAAASLKTDQFHLGQTEYANPMPNSWLMSRFRSIQHFYFTTSIWLRSSISM